MHIVSGYTVFMMRFLSWLLLIISLGSVSARAAERLPSPDGPVLLVVSGAIEQTNAPGEARFDRAMLEAIGMATLKTSTVWTDGVKTFEGIPLRKVLERVGARGSTIVASALNDYSVEFPLSDAVEHGPLLALKVDGRVLLPRDKGPIWIVYPRDSRSALQDPRYDQRWVWQLTRLHIR